MASKSRRRKRPKKHKEEAPPPPPALTRQTSTELSEKAVAKGLGKLSQLLDVFFDFFSTVLSVIDLVSDIWVRFPSSTTPNDGLPCITGRLGILQRWGHDFLLVLPVHLLRGAECL
jgi:hypothetical protein